jgi:hypothetical protein
MLAGADLQLAARKSAAVAEHAAEVSRRKLLSAQETLKAR